MPSTLLPGQQPTWKLSLSHARDRGGAAGPTSPALAPPSQRGRAQGPTLRRRLAQPPPRCAAAPVPVRIVGPMWGREGEGGRQGNGEAHPPCLTPALARCTASVECWYSMPGRFWRIELSGGQQAMQSVLLLQEAVKNWI
jgi:hypothetical protein